MRWRWPCGACGGSATLGGGVEPSLHGSGRGARIGGNVSRRAAQGFGVGRPEGRLFEASDQNLVDSNAGHGRRPEGVQSNAPDDKLDCVCKLMDQNRSKRPEISLKGFSPDVGGPGATSDG